MPVTPNFEQSELIGLIVAVPLLIAMLTFYRRINARYSAAICASAVFAFGAVLFTVMESITMEFLFNWLEHFCYAAASISLAIGAILASLLDKSLQRDRQI